MQQSKSAAMQQSKSAAASKQEGTPHAAAPKTNNGAGGVERVECECCGMSEDCTPVYIDRVRAIFCGRWVCGLCSEAVKEERLKLRQAVPMEEALRSHMALCRSFRCSRLNPQLSLASAMRDIARNSFRRRNSDDFFEAAASAAKLRRASFQ